MTIPHDSVREIIGTGGDPDIVDYILSVLEDEHFEFGDDAQDAFEALGPLLVSGECVGDDDEAHEVCRKLQKLLGGTEIGVNSSSKDNIEESNLKSKGKETFRTLTGGPVLLDEFNKISLHPSDKFDGKALIQGVFREGDAEDYSVMSEKDAAKLKKQKEKAQKAEQAAYEAHRMEAEKCLAGSKVEILRNVGGPVVKDIHLDNLSISNGGAELITNSDVTLAYGHKYGLVGRNGTGKTSLLRALAEREVDGIPKNYQILHVEQEIAGNEKSVLQTILDCDTERSMLLKEEQELMDSVGNLDADQHKEKNSSNESCSSKQVQRLKEISKRLIEIDAEGAESRAASILSGLSFTPEMMQRTTNSLSGGWRMRVALARALFVQPDLLLLDEPTNHLDIDAIEWLSDCLESWTKTIIIVSHMRSFLNEVATDIIHLQAKRLVTYRGNYDDFVKTRHERLKSEKAAAEAQAARREHMQAFVDKFRYNAKRASLVQSRIKALDRMDEIEIIEDDPEYHFIFPTPSDSVGASILSFDDVSFHYPGGRELFRDINFGINMQSRLAIVGSNGAGKTTLLNLISGKLEPTKGHVWRNPKARIAIFSQHHVDGMDLALTPLEYMKTCFPDAKEPIHRSHLASFGITTDLASQRMFSLSGGQKSRVALAKITWICPHLLLLDEPSNHLDIDAIDALIQGLHGFKGAVLMVSHDEYLIDHSVEELWVVQDSTLKVWPGDFNSYKKQLRRQRKST